MRADDESSMVQHSNSAQNDEHLNVSGHDQPSRIRPQTVTEDEYAVRTGSASLDPTDSAQSGSTTRVNSTHFVPIDPRILDEEFAAAASTDQLLPPTSSIPLGSMSTLEDYHYVSRGSSSARSLTSYEDQESPLSFLSDHHHDDDEGDGTS